MFADPQSRRLWRAYRLHADLLLSSVSPAVRRELKEDLVQHVRDLMAHAPADDPEPRRLEAALQRLGDPKEFLAPLLAEAVFRDPARDVGAGPTLRSIGAQLARGGARAWSGALILASGCVGALLCMVAAGSLLWPRRIGLFQLGADEYQVRILGRLSEGPPMLWPFLPIVLGAIGAWLCFVALRRARRLLADIIASA